MCVGLEVFYSVAGADTSDFHERATLIDSTPHRRGEPMSEQALCGACSHVKVCGQIPPDKMPCDQYTYDRPPAIDREPRPVDSMERVEGLARRFIPKGAGRDRELATVLEYTASTKWGQVKDMRWTTAELLEVLALHGKLLNAEDAEGGSR